ncbi:MAG: PAP/fibrillin family protein [Synechococcus sp.]|nr:PAP/fibrillin family protein [Synechococcus sp.]
MTAPPETAEACRRALLEALAHPPPDRRALRPLVEQLERLQPADLERDRALLRGVWELAWSSSSQPWLREGPWLENLQVLDPEAGRAMNLLRLRGPLGPLAAISVVASIAVEGRQRVAVRFERGGWIGPALGTWRPELLARVQQPTPAWLDITVLDSELRLCRGNAGTVFALRRRPDLRPEDLLPAA